MYDVPESVFPDPRLTEPTLLPSRERPLADASAGQQAGGPETLGASGSPGCSQPVPTWSIAIGGAGGGGAVLPEG